jgi:hypothetical protein
LFNVIRRSKLPGAGWSSLVSAIKIFRRRKSITKRGKEVPSSPAGDLGVAAQGMFKETRCIFSDFPEVLILSMSGAVENYL